MHPPLSLSGPPRCGNVPTKTAFPAAILSPTLGIASPELGAKVRLASLQLPVVKPLASKIRNITKV